MKTYILKGLFLLLSLSICVVNVGGTVPDRDFSAVSIPVPVVVSEEKTAEELRYNVLDSTIGINSRFYLDKLACLESGGNYEVKNRYGFMGKYQFGKRTLRGLVKNGYLDLSSEELDNFLKIPTAQEKAIDALIKANNDYLNVYKMNSFIGKRIGGVKITKEGLLAASHLVGPYAVVHFCKSGGSLEPVVTKNGITVKKHDGNGVYLTEYMRKFSV